MVITKKTDNINKFDTLKMWLCSPFPNEIDKEHVLMLIYNYNWTFIEPVTEKQQIKKFCMLANFSKNVWKSIESVV